MLISHAVCRLKTLLWKTASSQCLICIKIRKMSWRLSIMNNKVYKIYNIKEICWFNWLCTCRYTRMTPERFEHLLSMVGPRIKKQDTRMREAIGPAERLTLTLRYLASGNDQQSLSFSYRIGKATVSNIIHETLTAIWSGSIFKASRKASRLVTHF